MEVIMLVSFAGFNLIRFNGSRINGLSQEALRQDGQKYRQKRCEQTSVI